MVNKPSNIFMKLAYYFQAATKKPGAGPGLCGGGKGMRYGRGNKLAAFKRNIGRKSKFEMQYEAMQAACALGLAAKTFQGIAASVQKH